MNRRAPFRPLTWLAILVVVAAVIGLPTLLFLDMWTNRGNLMAQSVHHRMPQCSQSCHQ